MPCPFNINDQVKPKPEWADDPNNIPTGRVCAIARFGDDGAIYVEGERRAFAAYVFERLEPCKTP